LQDGTILDLEVIFIALDRPEETGKVRGLELTWGWLNEASEMAREAFDIVTQRVGRYPSMKVGGPSWSGVFMDTNAPGTTTGTTSSPRSTGRKASSSSVSRRGAYRTARRWKVNTAAENLENLPPDYYSRMVHGKAPRMGKGVPRERVRRKR
jgi:hypothetical protein